VPSEATANEATWPNKYSRSPVELADGDLRAQVRLRAPHAARHRADDGCVTTHLAHDFVGRRFIGAVVTRCGESAYECE